ncbi:MAG: DNA alkylation repair protein [Candidatus Coproplasma sp.]
MNYLQLLEELNSLSDRTYRSFHRRLLKNEKINVIGVRVPDIRKLAQKFKGDEEELLTFPDEFYEVTFIKLTACAALGYSEFVKVAERCVSLIDNWASCDSFKPACIAKHREEFKPYIERFIASDGEFSQRFALTTLLNYYVDEKFLPYIKKCLSYADTGKYYVHMAAAWLVAEILVKHFDYGVNLISCGLLDNKTANKAITKARESFRISKENKDYLNTLKRY